MGIDTKSYVATVCKDVMLTTRLVSGALAQLVREDSRSLAQNPASPSRRIAAVSRPEVRLSPEDDMATFTFKLASTQEDRLMYMFFRCDADNQSLAPQSLSFSLGYWGQSERIMKRVLHAMSLFGPVYYRAEDYSDQTPVQLSWPPLTVLQGIALRYISAATLQRYAALHAELAARQPDFRSYADFMGMDEAEVESLLAIESYAERSERIQALAQQRYPEPPPDIAEASTGMVGPLAA